MSTQPLADNPLARFGQILGDPDFTARRVDEIRRRGLTIRSMEDRVEDGLRLTRLAYDSDTKVEVPALMLHPDRPDLFGLPRILALHQTTEPEAIGKDEPAGQRGDAELAYGMELARRGALVLMPDYPLFGTYEIDLDTVYQDWGYASLSQKALVNHILALDVLQAWTGNAKPSIGVIGHSLGGSNALFLAAHDQRVTACVCSAGYSSFDSYARLFPMGLSGWAKRDKYMPRIAERFETRADRLPSDFDDILRAIAPRPLFISAPTLDDTFECASAQALAAEVAPLWPDDRLIVQTPRAPHSFPRAVQQDAYDALMDHLT